MAQVTIADFTLRLLSEPPFMEAIGSQMRVPHRDARVDLVRTSQRYGDKMKACWFIQAVRFMLFPPQMVDGLWSIFSVAPGLFDQNPMR